MTNGTPLDFFLALFSSQWPENLTLFISFWIKSLGHPIAWNHMRVCVCVCVLVCVCVFVCVCVTFPVKLAYNMEIVKIVNLTNIYCGNPRILGTKVTRKKLRITYIY